MKQPPRMVAVPLLLPLLFLVNACTTSSDDEDQCVINPNVRSTASPTPFICDDTGPGP